MIKAMVGAQESLANTDLASPKHLLARPACIELAVVHASGAFNWDDGNIGGGGTPENDLVLNYGQAYHFKAGR